MKTTTVTPVSFKLPVGAPASLFLILFLAAATVAPGAEPSVFLWDGGSGSTDNWTQGSNWNPDGAPGSPQFRINFAGSTRTSPNNNFASYSGGYRIFFNSGAAIFTLTGNPIKFFDYDGNRPRIQNDSANTQIINLRVGAGNAGGLDFLANAGDIVYDGGSIDNGTAFLDGSSQMRFDGSSGRTVTFNKGIINGDAAGSVAIRSNTIVVLNALSTYSAGTFMDAGQLWFTGNGIVAGTISLGPTAARSDNAGVFVTNSAGGKTITNNITIRSGGSGTLTLGAFNTSGENTYSGTVTLNKAATLSAAPGGTVKFSNVISGGNAITIGSSGNTGTILFDAANTYSGATTVSFGTLKLNGGGRIDNASAVTVNSGATFDLNGFGETVGSLAGAGSVTLNGGTLVPGADGTSTTFSGVISGTGAVTKTGGGVWTVSGSNTYNGVTTISDGTLRISSDSSLGNVPGAPVSSNILFNATAANGFNTILAISASTTLAANRGVTIGTNGAKLEAGTNTLTINGDIINNSGGNHLFILADGNTTLNGSMTGIGDIVKQGLGVLTLNGTNNTFTSAATNNIFFDKGTIQGEASGAFGQTNGWIQLGASGNANAGDLLLQLTASGATVFNNLDSRYFTAVTTNNIKTIGGSHTSGDVTFAGDIALHDNLTITAAGGGTVKVAGPIAQGGGTTGGQATNTADLLFSPGPGVVKTGAGLVEFSGTNSYVGETYVKAGTLQYNGSVTYANSTIRLGDNVASNNATLNIANATGGGVVGGVINTRAGAGGTKTMAASNTSGVNTYSGSIFLDSDATTLSANGGATLAFTSATFDIKNHALSVTGAGDTTISSSIANGTAGGTLTKTGTGTLTLAGNNTYSGATTINEGKVIVSGNSGPSAVAVNSGATLGGNGVVGGLTVNAGGKVAPGASIGRLTVTNLTLDASATNIFEFDAGAATNDTIHVLNNLTAGGSKIVVDISNGTLPVGHYRLIDFDGGKTGTFDAAVEIANGAAAAGLRVQESIANQVNLIVNATPVAVDDSYVRGSNTSFKVSIANLLANDTDADLDTLAFVSADATTTNGATLLVNNGFIFVPASTVNDAFSYTMHDGFGGTNSGNVFISVISTSGQGVSIAPNTNATVNVTFFGIPTQTYLVQRATNIGTPTWVDIATNVAPSNGVFTITDNFTIGVDSAPDSAFYRLLAP